MAGARILCLPRIPARLGEGDNQDKDRQQGGESGQNRGRCREHDIPLLEFRELMRLPVLALIMVREPAPRTAFGGEIARGERTLSETRAAYR